MSKPPSKSPRSYSSQCWLYRPTCTSRVALCIGLQYSRLRQALIHTTVLATYLTALNWRCRATSFTVFWATALPQAPSWISDGRFAAGKTKEGIGKGLGMEGDIRKEENGVGMKGKLIYATVAAIWIAIKLRRDAHYDHPITATLYVRQQSTHWRQQRLFRLIVLLAAPCTSSTTSAVRESWGYSVVKVAWS